MDSYYNAMKYILNVYNFFHRQSEYSVILADESELSEEYKEFINRYMQDSPTVNHIHHKIKEFKLKNKDPSNKQKALAILYTRYIDFPEGRMISKKYSSNSFFTDLAKCIHDGYKVIHHSHVTREIYGFTHNFCNKKVSKLCEKMDNTFRAYFLTVLD